MTVPTLHRRTPTPPINHGAHICPGCQARPLREHGLACPQVTATRGPAYPAEARVFRGLLIGLPTGAALYAALFFLIGAIA